MVKSQQKMKYNKKLPKITRKSGIFLIIFIPTKYNVINCLLVGCCMKRSEFERLPATLKQTNPDFYALGHGNIWISSLKIVT
jgi:hypothetical protein